MPDGAAAFLFCLIIYRGFQCESGFAIKVRNSFQSGKLTRLPDDFYFQKHFNVPRLSRFVGSREINCAHREKCHPFALSPARV